MPLLNILEVVGEEFYTSKIVSHLMAKMSFNAEEVIEKGLPITIGELTV